jgi:hypothetical protein
MTHEDAMLIIYAIRNVATAIALVGGFLVGAAIYIAVKLP